jgi:hypothetical protein
VPPPPPPRRRQAGAFHAVAFYLPNRVVDFLDVASLGVGIPAPPYLLPAAVHVNVHLTRLVQFGAGSTHGVFVGKGYDRRLAWGLIHHELSVGPLTVTRLERFEDEHEPGGVAAVDRVGVLLPSDPPFDSGKMDYLAIGVELGAGAAVQVDVHPGEVLDAVLGLVFIDIVGDDF